MDAAEANSVARSPAAALAIWVRSWPASVWALAKSDALGVTGLPLESVPPVPAGTSMT